MIYQNVISNVIFPQYENRSSKRFPPKKWNLFTLWGNLEPDLIESLILGKLKYSKDIHFPHENMV